VGQSRPLAPIAGVTTISASSAEPRDSRLVPIDAVLVRAVSRPRRSGRPRRLVLLIAVGMLSATVGATHGGRELNVKTDSVRSTDPTARLVEPHRTLSSLTTDRHARDGHAEDVGSARHRRSASIRERVSHAARSRRRPRARTESTAERARAPRRSPSIERPVAAPPSEPDPLKQRRTTSRSAHGPEFF
jgi:hypothetical protein